MIIALLAATVAAGPTTANGRPACDQVAGWQRAAEQKPSPVPWSEPVWNVAVQLNQNSWLWNGKALPEAEFLSYLGSVRNMNPTPLNLFAFHSELSCDEKQALQARIAAAVACPLDGKPCLDGTVAEYRAARGFR